MGRGVGGTNLSPVLSLAVLAVALPLLLLLKAL